MGGCLPGRVGWVGGLVCVCVCEGQFARLSVGKWVGVYVCMCVCVRARERGSETSDIFGGCLTISRDPGQLHQINHSFPYISII